MTKDNVIELKSQWDVGEMRSAVFYDWGAAAIGSCH